MDWAAWAKLVVLSVLGGLVLFAAVAGYYHVRYYVLLRESPASWKCQPGRFLRPEQQRQAVLLSTMNLTVGGVLSGTFIYFVVKEHRTPIYFTIEPTAWGWAQALGGTVVLFVLVDALAYYAHRALHARVLFRHVHRWHHRYVATSPFVVTAMHPAEFLFFQATAFIPLFVMPFHYLSAIAVFVYILVFNIVDHSGVRLRSSLPWQGPSLFHDDHHLYFHCNFGQCFVLWDRLHGTLRRTGRRYGADVFGGKGAPDAGSPGEPMEFVKY